MNVGFYDSLNEKEQALLAHLMTQHINGSLTEKNKLDSRIIEISHENKQIPLTVIKRSENISFNNMAKNSVENYFNDNAPHEFTLESLVSLSKFSKQEDTNKMIELERDAFITAGVNSTQGSQTLFDCPTDESSHMRIKFNQASFWEGLKTDNAEPIRLTSGKNILEIGLSSEQYVRMMRSDEIEVPCTIFRSHGAINDTPPKTLNTHCEIKEKLKIKLRQELDSLSSAVDEAITLITKEKLTTKKSLESLSLSLNKVFEEYDSAQDNLKTSKLNATKELVDTHRKRIEDQINYEVKRLPTSIQEEFKKKLIHLLEDTSKF